VIGMTAQIVSEVAEGVSRLAHNLGLKDQNLMKNISDFLLISSSQYRPTYESLLMEQQSLMGAMNYWQDKKHLQKLTEYESLLAGNAAAQRFLMEGEDLKMYMSYDARYPTSIYNFVTSLFLSSQKQRVNVLAEKFPLLFQATMKRL